MAKEATNKPTIQKKLFGPFNGLNGSQSPFLRELPPAPNAAGKEYATEFQNLEIDQKTQELVSRYGMEYADKGTGNTSGPVIAATAGLFKWLDYDSFNGKTRERALNLIVDEFGVPQINAYRLIKTQVRSTSATLDGKTFAIIEDPGASYAKRFVTYTSTGTINTSSTTLAGVANISISYVDYDVDRDGDFVLGAVDLVQPTSITYSSSNGTPTEIAEFWSLAKKATRNANLDLSDWLTSLSDKDATYFTAAQSSNVMFFSGGGVCPVLKYDGQNLYKAGMPNSGIHSRIIPNQPTVASFSSTYSTSINGTTYFEGLVGPESTTYASETRGRFIYMATYEHGDAKNNYAEGDGFLGAYLKTTDDLGSPIVGYYMSPRYTVVSSLGRSGGVVSGNVTQYNPPSLKLTDGYDARAAIMTAASVALTSTSDVASNFTLAVDATKNTLKAGDIVCMRANLSANSGQIKIPILITAKLSARTTTLLTVDVTYPITIELVPGGAVLPNAIDGILKDPTTDTATTITTSLQSVTTWYNLMAGAWAGTTSVSVTFISNFAISNNMRINIYRNKANANENNAYNPAANDGSFIPSLYLLNILPNNPYGINPGNYLETDIGPYYDNCNDGALGAVFVPKSTLQLEDKGGKDLTDTNYSSLPKGRSITSFKGRLYITDDIENANIVWPSDVLYGNEYFSVNDTLSMETPVGDTVKTVVGNEDTLYILKGNSIRMIISDLQNDRFRLDDIVIGDYGCTSARTACQVKGGVAYLTKNGPAFVSSKGVAYLGQNLNGISRIKDLLNDSELDLSRATAVVDTVKGHYKVYIPNITKLSAGIYNPTDLRSSDNPYYTDGGLMLVYDYNNDAWFKQTGINAKGGMVVFEEETDRLFTLTAYAKNTSASTSTLEWVLYKERNYNNLWAYADRLERGGTEELRAISHRYDTDWLALDDANMLKQFLRCKVYGLRVFTDLSINGASSSFTVATGSYDLTITAYKDWRSDSTHSQSTVSLSALNLYDYMKCRSNKAFVLKFSLTHAVLFSSPRIQAIEIEAVEPFKGRVEPWGAS